MKHLVVIPTYNESENIEEMLELLFFLYPNIFVLVVDDSSPDGTAIIVRNLKSKYKNLNILVQKKKFGLAKAYVNGFKWGLAQGFELFTTMDADFSHKPNYIADAVNFIKEGYDVACGARYIKGGSTTEKHWFRNFISKGGNLWINFIWQTSFSDILEGFNTIKKEVLEQINLDTIKSQGYIFGAELKYRSIKNGFKVAEFPISFDVRQKGHSKMDFSIIFEAFFFALKNR